jgi:hypothetical protein
MVAAPAYVETIRRQLADATFAIRLVDADARPATPPGTPSVTLLATESGLPWTLVVAEADPDRARAESRAAAGDLPRRPWRWSAC